MAKLVSEHGYELSNFKFQDARSFTPNQKCNGQDIRYHLIRNLNSGEKYKNIEDAVKKIEDVVKDKTGKMCLVILEKN
jgi:hypothetical protein